MIYKGFRRNARGSWDNLSWKLGSDAALYGDGGFYEGANCIQMVCYIVRGIKELGYYGELITNGFLDYGCGTGTFADILDGITDVDRYDPITFSKMPTKQYGVITCIHVIDHTDAEPLLRDIREYLSSGGLLIIVCHNVVGLPNKRARRSWHKTLYGRELVDIINASGYAVEARLTWGGSTCRIKWIKEAINKARKALGIGDVQMIAARRA